MKLNVCFKIFGYLIITPLYSFGQSAPQNVIGSAGDFATSSNYTMAWTLGEVISNLSASGGYLFTNGFHQPDTVFVTGILDFQSETISIYPNPATDQITLNFSSLSEPHIIEIINATGQVINYFSSLLNQIYLNIPLSHLEGGVYLLRILDTNLEVIGYYKIIKTH